MRTLGWMFLITIFVFSCKQRPKSNSAFYMNINSEPSSMNPIRTTDGAAASFHAYTVESLLERDDDTYEWIPKLATKWEIGKDNKTFTFWLREGVLFHDGSEMTAEDVEFSFKTTFDVEKWRNAEKQYYFETIESVKAVGKYKVEVKAKNEQYSNFEKVASNLNILSKKFYERDEKRSFFNKNLVATGPYKLDKWHRGNRILLVRNNKWWGFNVDPYSNRAKFPKVVMRFIGEPTVSLEMLKQGKLDILGMSPDTYLKKAVGKEWGKTVHKVETKNKSPKSYCFIGMNFKNPILKDKNVRKGLFHLLNRKLMIEKFDHGRAVPAIGPIYPDSPYATKGLKAVEYDPKEALRLLRKAGWSDSDKDGFLDKNGKRLSLTILEPGSTYIKYLTVFKEDARRAGVEINIKQIEWNSFLKLVTVEKNFEMCRLCWSAVVDWDPKQIWHTESIENGSNFISYSNPKVDKLTDEAQFVFDRDKRIKILQQVEQEIIDDVPYLFFSYGESIFYGYTDRIKRPKETFNYTIGSQYWSFKNESKIEKEL